jgi:hypothetical protein
MATISQWSRANEIDIGNIGFTDEGVMCICITKRQTPTWHPVHELSAANWMKNRSYFEVGIIKIMQGKKNEKKLMKKIKNLEDTTNMFQQLYEKLSASEKKEFLNKNSGAWLHKITCIACLEITEHKNKCIHHECCGHCQSCDDKWDKNSACPSCEQEQKKTCPICLCDKGSQELTQSISCSHSVCWECYGRAFRAQKPIYDCPLCRAEFTLKEDVLSESSVDDYSSDEYAMDDDIEMTQEDLISLISELAETPVSQELFPNVFFDNSTGRRV